MASVVFIMDGWRDLTCNTMIFLNAFTGIENVDKQFQKRFLIVQRWQSNQNVIQSMS
jgi:hypothetical protein